MHNRLAMAALAAATSLAACGGGGTSGNGYTPVTITTPAPAPSTAPTTAPTSAPTSTPQGKSNIPIQDMVAGAPAFVNPANHHTLYWVDGDTPPGAACSGSCTSEWPVLVPTSGSQPQGNLTIVTRTDGTQQWSYNGHALYEFAFDSGPDQGNGVYGPWHMARPQ
jgi:predicted lipoprotein with Yx(FWY)xxD motif